MFVELMPLLAGRTVMITVARENDKTVRVNVIPKKVREDENPALTTPLSCTGPPEELDVRGRAVGPHLFEQIFEANHRKRCLINSKPRLDVRFLASLYWPGSGRGNFLAQNVKLKGAQCVLCRLHR